METQRHCRIAVRISEAEKATLREIAWENRTTMSALIRSRIEHLVATRSESLGEGDDS